MKDKIVTILERHVEKIVLAVAVAGAGFIAWSGMQPTTLPSDPNVTATGVEDKVSEAVANVEAVRKSTQAIPDDKLTSALTNYVEEYNRLMLHHPLPETLVATDAVPRFAPLQESIGGVEDHGGEKYLKIATPVVPLPKNVTAVADRGSVLPPPLDPTQAAAMAAAPAAGAPLPQAIDKNWVCVSGNIPWKDYVDFFKNLPANQKLPDDAQHNVLYRIDVERRARTGTGWTNWEKVIPSKAGGDPIPDIDWDSLNDTDWFATVGQLDASFQRIAEPLFYYLAPKDPTQPPTPITAPITKATPTTAPAPGTPGAAPGATALRPGTRVPPVPTVRPNEDQEGNIIGPAAAAGQPAPGLALDVNALKQQGTVPFWFWDDSVAAGTDYEYRTRLVMYNPLYRFPNPEKLAQPGIEKQATIASAWYVISTPVSVGSDLAFFITANGFAGSANAAQKVSFVVFKWTNGGWYEGDWNGVEPGMPVSGPIKIVDKANQSVDVNTGFTLVDLQNTNNGDLVAILLSPAGELVTHSANADSVRSNPDRKDKEDKRVRPIVKPRPIAPTGTPTGPVTGTVTRTRGQQSNNPEDNQ